MKHFCTNTTSSMIMIRLFRKKFLMKCRIAEDRVSEPGSLIRYLQISYIVQNVEVLMDLGDGIAQRKMIRSGNVFIPTGMEDAVHHPIYMNAYSYQFFGAW